MKIENRNIKLDSMSFLHLKFNYNLILPSMKQGKDGNPIFIGASSIGLFVKHPQGLPTVYFK